MTNNELIESIRKILKQEIKNNPVSYNKDIPYQKYERINFDGLRWSVEKRIKEYKLGRFFNENYNILDIGSNFGFFITEFALHCNICHGIEPNSYLNEIAMLTAKYLNVDSKVKYFNCFFDDSFKSNIEYDIILTLASFFTQDGRQKGDAEKFFGHIYQLLNKEGKIFYESTSYTKDNNNMHYVAKNEAISFIKSSFSIIEEYETPSGSDGYYRYFILAKK
jgi:hypothetical protein